VPPVDAARLALQLKKQATNMLACATSGASKHHLKPFPCNRDRAIKKQPAVPRFFKGNDKMSCFFVHLKFYAGSGNSV